MRTRGRWLLVLGLLIAGPALGAGVAIRDDAASARTLALVADQDARVRTVARSAAAGAGEPFRATDGGDGEASIVLPQRGRPYALPELRRRFPDSFEAIAPDAALLTDHLVVGPGAHLVIAGDQLRELRLLSTPARFVTIAAWQGELDVVGTGRHRLAITSWNPEANGPDRDGRDGRAYVLARGGRMDVHRVDFSHLGFAIGTSSGVAWKGLPSEPSRGHVTDSGFRHNFFGAYTFEAVDMRWVGNVFAHNEVYGFDPHDRSDRFLVQFNAAFDNGRHGIIFSRGCRGNVIRLNASFRNGWHGIMLDDGKVADDGQARHREAVPSDDNVVALNVVWGNGEVGIALEGGSRNLIRANVVAGNRFGVRLKADASGNKIVGNVITGSRVFGVYLYDDSGRNSVTDNVVRDGKGGVVVKQAEGNVVAGNTLRAVSGHGVALVDEVPGTTVVGNAIAGRGSGAVDVARADGLATVRIAANRVDEWRVDAGPRPLRQVLRDFVRHHPAILIWATIFLGPLLAWGWRLAPAGRARGVSPSPRPAD